MDIIGLDSFLLPFIYHTVVCPDLSITKQINSLFTYYYRV